MYKISIELIDGLKETLTGYTEAIEAILDKYFEISSKKELEKELKKVKDQLEILNSYGK